MQDKSISRPDQERVDSIYIQEKTRYLAFHQIQDEKHFVCSIPINSILEIYNEIDFNGNEKIVLVIEPFLLLGFSNFLAIEMDWAKTPVEVGKVLFDANSNSGKKLLRIFFD